MVLVLNLLDEDLTLLEGVVKLSEGIADLESIDEQFESLGHVGLGSVVLRKRRHDLRMLCDEGRVDTVNFKEMTDELVNQTGGGTRSSADNLVDRSLNIEELASFL